MTSDDIDQLHTNLFTYIEDINDLIPTFRHEHYYPMLFGKWGFVKAQVKLYKKSLKALGKIHYVGWEGLAVLQRQRLTELLGEFEDYVSEAKIHRFQPRLYSMINVNLREIYFNLDELKDYAQVGSSMYAGSIPITRRIK